MMAIDSGRIFSPGDFVYFTQTDDQTKGVMHIERLWTDNNNEKMCYSSIFLRPYQTFHLQPTTRSFQKIGLKKFTHTHNL